MVSTQDLVKGIDLTGVDQPTLSQLNQLVDAGRLGPGMGMILVSYDTALNIPDVPDPNTLNQGVTPIWWKRYLWLRIPFDNTGVNQLYTWNERLTSAATLLKWQSAEADVTQIQAQLAAYGIQLTVTTNTASTAASNALVALTNAAAAQAGVAVLAPQLTNLNDALLALFPVGSLRTTLSNEVYSTTVNQGFLYCDGSVVSRTVFGGLYAKIGTTYGVGDGLTTFSIPDLRGRGLISDGPGAGLTDRVLGQTGGEESHLLSGQESGIQTHQHVLNLAKTVPAYGTGSLSNLPANGPNTGERIAGTDYSGNVPAALAHNNMQPFLVGRILIKT